MFISFWRSKSASEVFRPFLKPYWKGERTLLNWSPHDNQLTDNFHAWYRNVQFLHSIAFWNLLPVASTIDDRYTLRTIYTMNRRRQIGGWMATWPDIWKMQIHLLEEKTKWWNSTLYCIVIALAHLLSGISRVIYIYLLGECIWCKVVFIRVLNLRISTLGCVTIARKLLLVIGDFPISR